MIQMLITIAVLTLVYVNVIYLVSLVKKDFGIMDIAWGVGFVIIAGYSLFFSDSLYTRQIVITLLTTVWGGRLSLHIFLRNKDKPEDFRYNKWRKDWGKFAPVRAYFQVFILQGFLMIIFAMPVIVTNANTGPGIDLLTLIGAIVWFTGFGFETIGDYQLMRFKQNPANKGKIMTEGLWRYTRHPNYFGEALLWWGIWIIAIPVEYGAWTVLSPALLTFFLLKVSGIPMLERKYENDERYTAYKHRTNKFIPWKPETT